MKNEKIFNKELLQKYFKEHFIGVPGNGVYGYPSDNCYFTYTVYVCPTCGQWHFVSKKGYFICVECGHTFQVKPVELWGHTISRDDYAYGFSYRGEPVSLNENYTYSYGLDIPLLNGNISRSAEESTNVPVNVQKLVKSIPLEFYKLILNNYIQIPSFINQNEFNNLLKVKTNSFNYEVFKFFTKKITYSA
jgi:DNA-directed RNA polymerase subunit RPC12/RpoP